jgi:hypothetical protein
VGGGGGCSIGAKNAATIYSYIYANNIGKNHTAKKGIKLLLARRKNSHIHTVLTFYIMAKKTI